MTIQIGTPVRYRPSSGATRPGFVFSLESEHGGTEKILSASFNPSSGAITWGMADAIRDDIETQPNSWTPVKIAASTSVEVVSTATAETSANFEGV